MYWYNKLGAEAWYCKNIIPRQSQTLESWQQCQYFHICNIYILLSDLLHHILTICYYSKPILNNVINPPPPLPMSGNMKLIQFFSIKNISVLVFGVMITCWQVLWCLDIWRTDKIGPKIIVRNITLNSFLVSFNVILLNDWQNTVNQLPKSSRKSGKCHWL